MPNETGKRLRELRADADLTQENVAKLLNISREAYSLYESEKRQMNYESLCKIANYYDVSIDYLLGRTNIKKYYALKNDEAKLLSAFRRLDTRGKKILLDISKIVCPQ